MSKTIGLSLALAIAMLCINGIAAAQGTYSCPNYAVLAHAITDPSCGVVWHWDDLPDVNGPSTMVCCNLSNTFDGTVCLAPTAHPSCRVPPHTASKICISCLLAGSPINLSTGNTFIVESDISVPGLGGGLQLSRTWNSALPDEQSSYPFAFGQNWRSNFEEKLLFATGDGYLKYMRSDGSEWYFAVFSLGPPNVFKLAAPAIDTTTTLTKGLPSWTLTFKSGEKHLFDATSGFLTAIVDRNGNATTLAYDASSRLSTVTDAAQRHLYFNYSNGSTPLVASITSDVGISVSYAYDTQGRLTQMTKPDTTTTSFQYDSNSNITAVLDGAGKILESHTYDIFHRGLTSSRANGVDAVTVTYPQ
jgi:YD repeat-containing protein